ncbi:MAG TPA: hypothetical protein VGC94_00535 [Amnibacterium sp.]
MEIVPALGHVRLSDLRRRHVDRFVREMLWVPRQDGFCDVTIASDGLTLIDDVRRDARVARRRLAQGASGARFHAGVPIHTWDGYRIGAVHLRPIARDGRLVPVRRT